MVKPDYGLENRQKYIVYVTVCSDSMMVISVK